MNAEEEFYAEFLAKMVEAGMIEILRDAEGRPLKRNGHILYQGKKSRDRTRQQAVAEQALKEAYASFLEKKIRLN